MLTLGHIPMRRHPTMCSGSKTSDDGNAQYQTQPRQRQSLHTRDRSVQPCKRMQKKPSSYCSKRPCCLLPQPVLHGVNSCHMSTLTVQNTQSSSRKMRLLSSSIGPLVKLSSTRCAHCQPALLIRFSQTYRGMYLHCEVFFNVPTAVIVVEERGKTVLPVRHRCVSFVFR